MFALALAYPLAVHAAVLWPQPWLQWLALALLCVLVLYHWLRAGRWWAWCALAGALAASAALVAAGHSWWALLVPPIAIPLSLLVVFASSLRGGQVPMVTRFARLMRGTLPADIERYTRSVTVLWVLVLSALTLSAVLLALFASRELWSLATNFIHYGVLGLVFVLEYLYRRWRFRHHEHPGFWAYIRGIAPARSRPP